MKIFYNPTTLKVIGMSDGHEDGHDSLSFPFFETKEKYHSTLNMKVEIIHGEPTLKINGGMEGSETEKIIKHRKKKHNPQ